MEGPGERPAGFPSAHLHRGRLEGTDGQRGSQPISNLRTNAGSGSDATCRCPSPPIPNRTPGRGAVGHCLRHPHRMRDLISPLCGDFWPPGGAGAARKCPSPSPCGGDRDLMAAAFFGPRPPHGGRLCRRSGQICAHPFRLPPAAIGSRPPARKQPPLSPPAGRRAGEDGQTCPSRGTPCFLPPDAVE